MTNMSYCRFQNTLSDLRDCLEALHNQDKLSADEARAAKRLISVAREIAEYTDHDIDFVSVKDEE
jgi:hypothetical protein